MKNIIIITCFIFSFVMYGGLIAQNNNAKSEKSIDTSPSIIEPYKSNTNKKFNSIDPFVGVWSLEKTVLNSFGQKKNVYLGTFMVVNSDGTYTIFVYTNEGGVITSSGRITVESSTVYLEKITQHVNGSLVGTTNRIDYMFGYNTLYKSFWIEKDSRGRDYQRQENEVWKRLNMPPK